MTQSEAEKYAENMNRNFGTSDYMALQHEDESRGWGVVVFCEDCTIRTVAGFK